MEKPIIIDIETVAQSPLSEIQLDWLSRKKVEGQSPLEMGALFPLTGKVFCVGLCNPNTMAARVIHEASEREILIRFWDLIQHYNRFVTFNGRGFDIPFLLHRSAILGVTPTVKDLMGSRYKTFPHYDLMDQMSFNGAAFKPSLAIACEQFGIENPKQHGSGADVGKMVADGRLADVLAYCESDVIATAKLFQRWREIVA